MMEFDELLAKENHGIRAFRGLSSQKEQEVVFLLAECGFAKKVVNQGGCENDRTFFIHWWIVCRLGCLGLGAGLTD